MCGVLRCAVRSRVTLRQCAISYMCGVECRVVRPGEEGGQDITMTVMSFCPLRTIMAPLQRFRRVTCLACSFCLSKTRWKT